MCKQRDQRRALTLGNPWLYIGGFLAAAVGALATLIGLTAFGMGASVIWLELGLACLAALSSMAALTVALVTYRRDDRAARASFRGRFLRFSGDVRGLRDTVSTRNAGNSVHAVPPEVAKESATNLGSGGEDDVVAWLRRVEVSLDDLYVHLDRPEDQERAHEILQLCHRRTRPDPVEVICDAALIAGLSWSLVRDVAEKERFEHRRAA